MKRNEKRLLGVGSILLVAFAIWTILIQTVDVRPVGVVNGRFCPQSVRSFCPIVAGFNAGTYKVPACVL